MSNSKKEYYIKLYKESFIFGQFFKSHEKHLKNLKVKTINLKILKFKIHTWTKKKLLSSIYSLFDDFLATEDRFFDKFFSNYLVKPPFFSS